MPLLRPCPLVTAVFILCWTPTVVVAQRDSFSGAPIHYGTATVHDPVAKLAERVAAGEQNLDYDTEHGYLPAVLAALDIPVSSQMLVFSKTSLQLHRISPKRPRAIYFNDDVYVGWCQHGDVLEIAATDPQQGATFYTLDQTPQKRPKFARDQGQCLSCHASGRTQDIPGYFVRSVYPDTTGRPLLSNGSHTTDVTSPLEERWGGWYVTGSHGSMRHMGNVFCDPETGQLDRELGANRQTLESLVSTEPYLSEHSDIVALMVLEHQTQMHNALAAANYDVRIALHQTQIMNVALDREPDYRSDSCQRRIESAIDRVVEHLLLCDEFPLTSAVSGTSGFQAEFEQRGRRDAQGRSLRDLDLQRRLLRYPCSYMIYSAAFDGLPDEVRTGVLLRLRSILEGRDSSEDFDHLSAEDRRHILEILHETQPEFAATGVSPANDG